MKDHTVARTGAPTRRAVMRGAAWTAPALVVAAVAPPAAAYSGPPLGTLALTGLSGVERNVYESGWTWDLRLAGASLQLAGGPGIATGGLQLTVTFTSSTGGGIDLVAPAAAPTGLSLTSASGPAPTLTFTNTAPPTAGSLSLADGTWLSTVTGSRHEGTFTVTATAAGYDSATWTVQVPAPEPVDSLSIAFDPGLSAASTISPGNQVLDLVGATLTIQGAPVESPQEVVVSIFFDDTPAPRPTIALQDASSLPNPLDGWSRDHDSWHALTFTKAIARPDAQPVSVAFPDLVIETQSPSAVTGAFKLIASLKGFPGVPSAQWSPDA